MSQPLPLLLCIWEGGRILKTGTTFLYDGKSSSEFGIIVGGSGVADSYEMGLDRSVISGDINRFRTQVNHVAAKYDSVLKFSFSVIKDPCQYHGDDMFFTRQEIRNINAWLTSQELPKILYFPDDEEDIYYYAVIDSVDSDVANTKVYKLTYDVTCNAPWGFSALKVASSTYDKNDPDSQLERNVVVVNTSDDTRSYIYPVITIEPHADGSVTITNNSDNSSNGNSLTIEVKEKDTVTIDCRLCTFMSLSGVMSLSNLGFEDVGNVYIPKFKYGENNIMFSGDADLKIEWREPRKVGIA